MEQFEKMLHALKAGQSIRRKIWDAGSKLFVQNGKLMMQASGAPYAYDLSWYEMAANDWSII